MIDGGPISIIIAGATVGAYYRIVNSGMLVYAMSMVGSV